MTWDQPVNASVRLPADKDLGAWSIDQVVREVLWLVADGEANWDRGYSLFLWHLLRFEQGTMKQRVGWALDNTMVKMVEGRADRDERLRAACDRRREIGGQVPQPDYNVKGMPRQPTAPAPAPQSSSSSFDLYGLTRSDREDLTREAERESRIRRDAIAREAWNRAGRWRDQ